MSSLDYSCIRRATRLPALTALACTYLLALVPVAHAARHYPKAIKDAMNNGAKVVKSFPAASGLTGWVLSQNGTYSVAYTTADNKTLIIGNLINEKGENLTDQYAEKYFPKPDRSALFEQMEHAAHVVEGTLKNPKKVLYVFADANSPHCQSAWKALKPYLQAGLQVRWIPVATLEPSSMPKAIEMLDAADPSVVFNDMEKGSAKSRPGTTGGNEAAKPDTANKIKKNNALMHGFGISSVPGLVWKDRAGAIQVKIGMPRLSEIPAITGLPHQKNNDPALEKFK